MVEVGGSAKVVVGAVIAIFLVVVIVANIFPTALGTIANSTTGNAMKNVDAGTKALYGIIGLFSVIGIVVVILKATHII